VVENTAECPDIATLSAPNRKSGSSSAKEVVEVLNLWADTLWAS